MSVDALDHREAVGRAFAGRVRAGAAVFQGDISGLPALPFTVSRDGENRRLTGGNLFVLLQAMKERGWTDPRFFTGAQAEEAGYQIRPDAAGIRVQYLVATQNGEVAEAPTVKTFMVFNASEMEGVPALEVPAQPSLNDIEEALQRSGLRISHDEQNRAFVAADASIRMPPPSAFGSMAEYLAVAVHEWQHVLQGAVVPQGTPQSAEVELRAEMASSLLSVMARLPHDTERHRGYAAMWAESLDQDPMLLFRAARDAEQLASLVMWQVRQVAQEKTAEGLVIGSLSAEDLDGLRTFADVKVLLEKVTTLKGLERLNDAVEERISRDRDPLKLSDVEESEWTSLVRQKALQLENGVEGKGEGKMTGNAVVDEPQVAPWLERAWSERQAVLAVPYGERERAKDAGAIWYKPLKVWFVPAGKDLEAFKEWNPREHALGATASRNDIIENFKEAMASLGLDTSGEVYDDGKWHYVKVSGKKHANNKSGAYVLNMDGRDGTPVGTIQNKDSGETLPWKYDGALLTPEQKAQMRAEALAREAKAAKEAAEAQDRAAVHAAEIMAEAGPADGHGYARSKGLDRETVASLRQVPGSVLMRYEEFHGETGGSIIREREKYLIVPMQDLDGRLRAVQAISEDGKVKTFMRGAQKKGTVAVLGAGSVADAVRALEGGDATVAFTEGIATGGSFRSASRVITMVCFDAGNLEVVAPEVARKMSPGTVSVLGADNDQFHVERAMGYLAEKLGVSPIAGDSPGNVVQVATGPGTHRAVSLGEVKADGEWHGVPAGRYRVAIEKDGAGNVDSVSVEVAKEGQRVLRNKFENRGWTAAKVAKAEIEKDGGLAAIAVPEFSSLKGRPTDWNDLAQREGLGVARRQLELQLEDLVRLPPVPALERGRGGSPLPAGAGRQMEGVGR